MLAAFCPGAQIPQFWHLEPPILNDTTAALPEVQDIFGDFYIIHILSDAMVFINACQDFLECYGMFSYFIYGVKPQPIAITNLYLHMKHRDYRGLLQVLIVPMDERKVRQVIG